LRDANFDLKVGQGRNHTRGCEAGSTVEKQRSEKKDSERSEQDECDGGTDNASWELLLNPGKHHGYSSEKDYSRAIGQQNVHKREIIGHPSGKIGGGKKREGEVDREEQY